MNRPIKFRAWHKEKKEMWPDVPLLLQVDSTRPTLLNLVLSDMEQMFAVMQFTGLHDKNGKEIYEGDVVRWRSHPKPMKLAEVAWSDSTYSFYLRWFDNEVEREQNYPSHHSLQVLNHIEVIGNIYENPELLKGQNK